MFKQFESHFCFIDLTLEETICPASWLGAKALTRVKLDKKPEESVPM
jgi:hypothetical protein